MAPMAFMNKEVLKTGLQAWISEVPELGTMRWPPWELKEPSAVQDGSLVRSRVWVWVRRPMVLSLPSSRQCGSLGDSLEENSPARSS